jgi:hypothetical protein
VPVDFETPVSASIRSRLDLVPETKLEGPWTEMTDGASLDQYDCTAILQRNKSVYKERDGGGGV